MFLNLESFTALKAVKISFSFVNWEKQLMILKFFRSDVKFSLGTEHLSGSVLCYVLNNTFTIAVAQLFYSLSVNNVTKLAVKSIKTI